MAVISAFAQDAVDRAEPLTVASRPPKMQASRASGYVYYRCRFAAEYALANKISHPRTSSFARPSWWGIRRVAGPPVEPDRVEATIDVLALAREDPGADQHAAVQGRRIIRDCEAKMARWQAAIVADADIQE